MHCQARFWSTILRRNERYRMVVRSKTKFTSEWIQPEGYDTGIKIFNPMTKQKDPLILPRGKNLSWYTCGPTVYSSAHVGHAATYMSLDIIRRILTNFFDLRVVYMMGITDIDDKIIKKSIELDEEFTTLTSHYEQEFFRELTALNILSPTIKSRVTDNLTTIIDFLKILEQKGVTYIGKDGSLYFDRIKYGYNMKFVPPGLGGPDPSGVKQHTLDFALWKAAKKGEPFWDSPWGYGRPGWHIECSAMASRVFGQTIDIHSGGSDLLFPHHENEIAQSLAYYSSEQWVNYWIHTGFVHMPFDEEKMSKSLGNTVSVPELLSKHSANHFRMLVMLRNYTSNLEFCEDGMHNAAEADASIGHFLRLCDSYVKGQFHGGEIPEAEVLERMKTTEEEIYRHLRNDFNTPSVIEALQRFIIYVNGVVKSKNLATTRSPGTIANVAVFVKRICRSLGFHKKGWKPVAEPEDHRLEMVVDKMLHFRKSVRDYARDPPVMFPDGIPDKERKVQKKKLAAPLFNASDELRSTLLQAGVRVYDEDGHVSWEFTDSNLKKEKDS